MSIAEFSATLKTHIARGTASKEAEALLNRLAKFSTESYKSRISQQRNASILQEDSSAFRLGGEKQGYTRLVVTEDSLKDMIVTFNISGNNLPEGVMDYYINFLITKHGKYKTKHFEFYTATNQVELNRNKTLSSIVNELASKDIIAVRSLNFSHNNALNHMADFLIFLGVKGTRKDVSNAISSIYERGHIYAQTTGRQLISIGGLNKEEDLLDKIVKLSVMLDEATTGISKPKYKQLMANIYKDFSSTHMRMNIEFQLKRDDYGTGNQDSAEITKGLRIISTLRNLLDNVELNRKGALISTPTGVSLKILDKQLEALIVKLAKYEKTIVKSLANLITNPQEYIADLKSSDSLKDFLEDSIVTMLKTGKNKSLKVNRQNVLIREERFNPPTLKKTSPTISAQVSKKKSEISNIKKLISGTRARTISGQFTSLTSIQNLLNMALHDQIRKNMGKGNATTVLNYRTGRFAHSAKVTNMRTTRDGAIEAVYTYMKMPYATFEPDGRQGSPISRDPRKLIERSMREIATTLMQNRLRAIPS